MKELVYHRRLLPAASRHANRPAIVDGAYRATHGEHLDRVARLAAAMSKDLGLGRDQAVAVLAANSHRYIELWHAALLGAAIITPLNARLSPDELAFIVQDSGAAVLVSETAFAETAAHIKAAAGVRTVVGLDGDVPGADASYEDLLGRADHQLPDEPEEDDPAVLMYTGGTTGLPKGVVLDQRAVMLNLHHQDVVFRIDDDAVFLHQAPMFHAAAMGAVLGVPAAGGLGVTVPMFDVASIMHAIEQHRVTITVMVPTMLAMMLAHPEFAPARLASLRAIAYGAAPMPPPLLTQLLTALPYLELLQGYGMTETCGVVTILSPADHREGGAVLGSVGRPLRGIVVEVQDHDGNAVPAGTAGEVCIRAGKVMREYWRRPEETADALRGGWLHSGDVGYLDADGYLHLVDRIKDMIVTGGENVYSLEVEQAMASHHDVLQVAVIGIPDATWGEAVHAVVVLRPDATATAADLQAHARERLAGYKVPKSVELRSLPLPMSGAMKPLKRELRRPFWEQPGAISAR
jgi:acyl-CoA synthetase (AMP-forming)/AMP-acid ligase II